MLQVLPLLILGLGGMGTLCIRYIKEKLIERYGMIPPFIQLLAFDTTGQERGGKDLANNEFRNLLNFPTGKIITAIITGASSEYDHIREWFPDNLPARNFIAGVEAIKAMGRLIYFHNRDSTIHDLISAKILHLTDAALPDAANEAGFKLATDRGTHTYVICSLCGGTGAGMFLDVTYDLRWWLSRKVDIIESTGCFVLPEAFPLTGHSQQRLYANCYASLMELEHYMSKGNWRVRHRSETVEVVEPPFQYCYLFNGERMFDTVGKDDVARIIAEAVVAVNLSPVGKQLLDNIAIIRPNLSQLDDYGKLLAYSFMGISRMEVEEDDTRTRAKEALRYEVANRLVGQATGRI